MEKTVLVVDDSQSVRQQVGKALETAGFTIVEAADGVEGLEQVNTHANLAAVICDVNMPRMNGLEFVEAMKDRIAKLPVLMLTTEGQADMIQRARQAGAKGWIVKPFKPDVLVAALRRLTGTT